MLKNATAQYVCWRCRRGHGTKFQLFRVDHSSIDPDSGDVKNFTDYICKDCKKEGFLIPDNPGSSRWPYPTKAEIEEFMRRLEDSKSNNETPTVPQDQSGFKDHVAVKEQVAVQLEPPES